MEVYQLEWARFLRICGQVPQEGDKIIIIQTQIIMLEQQELRLDHRISFYL